MVRTAQGEWVGFLDHDDLLEPDALFQNVKWLQDHRDADLIYSDEDKLTEEALIRRFSNRIGRRTFFSPVTTFAISPLFAASSPKDRRIPFGV